MPAVRYQETTVSLGEDETVLDGLLREGIDAAHSCRSGCCHACMLRASSGVPPPASQETLKDSLRAKGYFLACIAHPAEDLVLASPAGDDVSVKARIVDITILEGDVARVLIEPQGSFDYKPGQFLNLVRGRAVFSQSRWARRGRIRTAACLDFRGHPVTMSLLRT